MRLSTGWRRSVFFVSLCAVAGCANQAGIIQAVEAQTEAACHFLPQAGPVLQLIPMFGGAADKIAGAICTAVERTPRAAAAPGTTIAVPVGNVQVTGVLVR